MPAADPEITVIGDIVRRNARRYADHDAVVHGSRRLSWAQLEKRVIRLSNALSGLGVLPGDRISVLAENCLEYFELFHATATAGVIAVPLNQRLAPPELESIVARVEPKVVFHDNLHRDAAESLASGIGARTVRVDDGAPGDSSYDQMLAAASTVRLDHRPSPGDPATICFTGGTTGLPKGCIISHGALIENGRIVPVTHGLRPLDRHLFVRPMAVAPGHRMVSWHGYLGGTTVIADRFEPGDFFRLVETEQVNASLLSPTMFQMLLDDGNFERRDVSSLRSVAYGGAPIAPNLLARVLEVFSCDFHQNYGGSEAAIATHLTPEHHRQGRLDSVGPAAPGVEIRIVDAEGRDLPDGEAGEILVRSGQVFSGYWNDPENTAAALRDGFYWSGDLAIRVPDGHIKVVGRNKDLIISGGYNVYPIEVENVLAAHPAVREAAVIGVPDERWGEAVHALVVLIAGSRVTADDLVAYCREHIASYKKPRTVEFVDELPRTTVGKIAKGELRDRYLTSLASDQR